MKRKREGKRRTRNPIQKIQWAEGSRFGIAAEVAFKEVERIRARNGGEITADILLEEARDKRNPLHAAIFNRGTKAAALEWYLHTARRMIGALQVVYDEMPEQAVRHYHVVSVEKGKARYGGGSAIFEAKEYREFVLQRALKDLNAWKDRYKHLKELSNIIRVIEESAA